MIHNPEATEGLRNRTTISVVVPEDAGNALGAIVLRQLPNLDQWDWGRMEPRVYLGDYSLRGKGARGLATALVSCLLYTSPSPRDLSTSRMPSSA